MKTSGDSMQSLTFRHRSLASRLAACLAGAALTSALVACGSSGEGPGADAGISDEDSGGGTHPSDSGSSGGDSGNGNGHQDSGGPDGGTSPDGAANGPDSGASVDGSVDIDADWLPDPASHVNTLIGTTNDGNTFPGADYPFGMLQWSPDTSPDRDQGGGYEYTDTNTIGFSLTHISGPGCGAFGDVPILPITGGLPGGDPGTYTQPLSHTGEVASAGYYSVSTGAPAITTELTATKHSSMARFTYPAGQTASMLIKLLASQNGSSASSAAIVGTNEVTGSTTSGHFCGAPDVYTMYFDIIFDQPFKTTQIVQGTASPNVVFLTFDTSASSVVQAKVSISFVSVANAKANWTADNPNWDFNAIKTAAHDAWNAELNKIQVAGGTASDQESFYTALYHVLLHPNVFSDVNGQYMGFDNAVHSVTGTQKDQYANYSGWDIYHGQVQLSALIDPQAMSDSAQSMLNDAAQNSGMLPKWALANGESYVMVGDPADGIIAGYYAFGARNFDTATALSVMVKEATVPNNIRPALSDYMNHGYIFDDVDYNQTECCNYYGSVATVLEYGEADFAISQFAAALGDTTNAGMFLKRSQNWQNVFDPSVNRFNPRLSDGTFVPGLGLTSGTGMVEGSASEYRWIVSYDRQPQLTLMGGPSVVNPALTSFFTTLDGTNAAGALMANEFEIGAQYWPDYSGQPSAAQDTINRIRTQFYADAPAYVGNNDDLGALASQLAWSILGIFPTHAGSAEMSINGPEFPAEVIHLPSGNVITITGAGASDSAPYIQSLDVDGKPQTAPWLPASVMDTGAQLDFTMGATASPTWGAGAADVPPSYGMESTTAIGFVSATGPVVIAPSASAQVTFGAQSARSDVAQTVSWTATPPAGVGVAPSSGSLSLATSAQGTTALTITAPATAGQYLVPFALTSSLGAGTPSFVLPVFVAPAGSLIPYYNDTGISTDGTGSGNFDGDGYTYSAQALQAAERDPGAGR